jgi:hypothetical protein
MAKRFTDTDKWKKRFIRNLDINYKVLWLYILDDCNHAGIWDVDIDVAQIRTGCTFDIKEAIKIFGDKINVFDNKDKWFIPDFIEFQYGTLNPKNRVHESVLSLLDKYKNKGLIRGLLDPKDKDKDKDKKKDKKEDKDFAKAIDLYISCQNPTTAKKEWDNLTDEDRELILTHAGEYRKAMEKADSISFLPDFSKYLFEKMYNIPIKQLLSRYNKQKNTFTPEYENL